MRNTLFSALLLLCAIPQTSARAQGQSALGRLADLGNRYVFTMGYANDNVILEDVVGNLVASGLDDLVTTSFWLRVDRRRAVTSSSFGATLDVLTHRDGNYRTDLLAVRATREPVGVPGRLRIGTGIIARGNFGGSAVQNRYHALFDYGRVDLPYTNGTRLAPLVNVHYRTNGLRLALVNVAAFASAENTFSVGPSFAKAGIKTACCGLLTRSSQFSLRIEGEIAYARYYHLHETIAPMFGKGLATGLSISAKRVDRLGATIWLTRNQYGVANLPQFGMSFSYGWGSGTLR